MALEVRSSVAPVRAANDGLVLVEVHRRHVSRGRKDPSRRHTVPPRLRRADHEGIPGPFWLDTLRHRSDLEQLEEAGLLSKEKSLDNGFPSLPENDDD